MSVDQYFEVRRIETTDTEFWWLGGMTDANGQAIDTSVLTYGGRVDFRGPLGVEVREPGRRLDVTGADFGALVVLHELAEAIQSVAGADVQLYPAVISGTIGEYDVLNIVPRLPCLDTEHSQVVRWPVS